MIVGLVFVVLWGLTFLLVLCTKCFNTEDGLQLLLLRLFLVLNAAVCCASLSFPAVVSHEVLIKARSLEGVVIRPGDFGFSSLGAFLCSVIMFLCTPAMIFWV